MEKLDLLDKIVLSEKVVENFYKEYNKNLEFRKWLNKLVPEVEACRKQKQNNPWHIYNVLDHILHSVEEMNKQTVGMEENERRLLSYIMFFHDLGKSACHIVRNKNGREIDSFFNHNRESAKIVRRVVKELKFNEKEAKIIEKLVFLHDIFINITLDNKKDVSKRLLTESLVREEINNLQDVGDGKKMMNYLILIGRSDNLAQNPDLTKGPLAMLDKFENILNLI